MRSILSVALISIASMSLLEGCLQKNPPATVSTAPAGESINQRSVCQVENWQRDAVAQACRPGQKVAYLPNRWGNEQLPIYFAAVNCDLRYSVVHTNGGVACIYLPTPGEAAQATEPTGPAAAASAANGG